MSRAIRAAIQALLDASVDHEDEGFFHHVRTAVSLYRQGQVFPAVGMLAMYTPGNLRSLVMDLIVAVRQAERDWSNWDRMVRPEDIPPVETPA